MRALFFILLMVLTYNASLLAQCRESMPYWLLGTWEIQNNGVPSFEQWKNMGDTLFVGRTYGFVSNDTIQFDEMAIKCVDGKPVYFMHASMDTKRVFAGFSLTEQPDSLEWTFVNPITDFPHAITYMRYGNNEMYVWFNDNKSDDPLIDVKLIRKE